MKKEKIAARLAELQSRMKENKIAVYIVSMNDNHGSEYIGEYYKLIRYFSGFTGSAGTLVVTKERGYLWTDGRYFLQAGQQLSGTGITLQKMGEKQVPSVSEFVFSYMAEKENAEEAVGFDGRLVSEAFAEKLEGLKIVSDIDIAGEIWNRDRECPRPEFPNEPVWILKESYAGISVGEKLVKIREDMKKEGADVLLLSTPDDIAWLTNLRGNDIAYNPVFLSFLILENDRAGLYCSITDEKIKDCLRRDGIDVFAYEDFYGDICKIAPESCVWIDKTFASHRIYELIPDKCKKLEKHNPVMLRKAVKNETEIENIKEAHIRDGVAVTSFIYWLKNSVRTGREAATEDSAAKKLEELRRQQENYVGESFAPIVAFKEHGAIVHYSSDGTSDAVIKPESFLLCDVGGHYLQGTTDITRTIAMGELSEEQKTHYTAVLQGNLRLMNARFLHGLTGANLDYIAREPLYRLGLDFNHGTGHGVGYLLNVHEGPNAFRTRYCEDGVFEDGMVTSDEPGVYLEGKYGIRLENLILCKTAEETEYGQFMCFEPLTMAPFDPEAVKAEMLTEEDKELLNAYHEKVYEQLADRLPEEVRKWLYEVTKPIGAKE